VNTEEGIKMRNTMHFRVESDAFIPAGRHNTIDEHNYKSFFKPDRTPSSPRKGPTKASMFPLVFSCIEMNVVKLAFYIHFFRFFDLF
jgi:hypothetical protein